MEEVKILIVDDDPVTLTYVSKILAKKGYQYETAQNGKLALDKLSQDKFSILLTDISMPEMDGKELIQIVSRQFVEIVPVVMSANMDVENLLATLNENKAYSYLLKPLDAKNLLDVIEKAQEHYQLLQKAMLFSESEKQFYKNIMDTFKWKDELHAKQVTSIATDIIRQLNISFSHGGGIGSLLSVLSLVTSMAKFNDEKNVYELPKDLFSLIDANFKSAKKMLESFSSAQTILMEEDEYTGREELGSVYEHINECVGSLEPAMDLKKQRISLSNFPPHAAKNKIVYNKNKMAIVFNELFINSMKYSQQNDKIYVMFFMKDAFFELKILNPAYASDHGIIGIKGNDEKNVFEPFYRMSAMMDDVFTPFEDFSYGLGLPVIKKILSLHKADIFLYTVKNLSMGGRNEDVCATLRFPIA